jgi:hypothetical protein
MGEEKFNYAEYYKKFYEAWEKTMSEAIEMWTKSPFLSTREGGEKESEFDPVAYYKKFYSIWENSMSEVLDMWLKSPFFGASLGKAVEKSSEFKKYLDEVMERSLKNLHLPTKSDIDRILASVNKIEAKINDLWDKLEELKAEKESTRAE